MKYEHKVLDESDPRTLGIKLNQLGNEGWKLVRPNWVSSSVKRTLEKNGPRRIRFHDLCHSCAALLRHEGVAMETSRSDLGTPTFFPPNRSTPITTRGRKWTNLKRLQRRLRKEREAK